MRAALQHREQPRCTLQPVMAKTGCWHGRADTDCGSRAHTTPGQSFWCVLLVRGTLRNAHSNFAPLFSSAPHSISAVVCCVGCSGQGDVLHPPLQGNVYSDLLIYNHCRSWARKWRCFLVLRSGQGAQQLLLTGSASAREAPGINHSIQMQ